MIIFLLLCGLLIAHAASSFVVSYHFIEVEKLYMKVRNRQEPDIEANPSSAELKRICQRITDSEYFKMIGKATVNMETAYAELERYHSKLFEKLHSASSYSGGKRTYSNSLRLTNVAVTREHLPEFTFVCLARNRETKKLEEYYVSRTYNVNTASHFVEDSVAGYFIFRYIAKAGVMALHSFAEESSTTFVSNRLTVEELYLRARENCESANTPENDPLCRLSDYQKMRVCATVHFDDTVKFIPSTNCVLGGCVKNTVSFREERARAASESANARGLRYEEWMIGCRARNVKNASNFKNFYVSRAYRSNKVFVYKMVYDYYNRENVYLEHQSVNVSLVRDECTRNGNQLAIHLVRNN